MSTFILAKQGSGTREYNFTLGTRTAVTATSSAAVPIAPLGNSREIMIVPSVRCFIRFGASDVAAATVDLGQLVVPADTMFHIRVPENITHFRVIRDSGATSDGFVSIVPVA